MVAPCASLVVPPAAQSILSLLPDCRNWIRPDIGIAGDKRYVFGERLGDIEAVKWVAVNVREGSRRDDVIHADREQGYSQSHQVVEDFRDRQRTYRKTATTGFIEKLPDRSVTDQKFIFPIFEK